MALENGWVDADRNAFVSLRLAKGEPIECLIDTGFNRELFLPLDLAESLELRITGEQEFIVAGGARLYLSRRYRVIRHSSTRRSDTARRQ